MRWTVKQYLKPRYILLGIVIIVFCFVPVVDMEYLVMVEKQVLEPYTVLEEVKEPYQDYYDHVIWEERIEPAIPGTSFGETSTLYPRIEQRPITRYRTVIKEVTKTRLVTRPVAETRTKRVSILRYLLR